MMKLHATLATLAILGGPAHADDVANDEGGSPSVAAIEISSSSRRGVAQDYIVLPAGGELTGTMRFVTSQPSLGGEPLRFSDLALFGLSGRWALFSKLELSAGAEFLPKQPSFTNEKPWQSVSAGLRSPISRRVALSISGAGGHLMNHSGMWTREAIAIQWRKPIADVMTFDLAGGMNGVSLSAPRSKGAFLTELSLTTAVLFREPSAWTGISYALPVTARGEDPTTGMAVDPQPRLDFRIGTVLSLVRAWDLYVEYAIVDRGDLGDPATRLPILDGGFDQHQVIFGVTRHFTTKRKRSTYGGDAMQLGMR